MTRVDFYVLEDASADTHDRMICRVVEKAWQQGHRVFVRCADDAAARAFDELLWRFQDVSFVPHALAATANGAAPVVIGTAAPATPAAEVLVNLAAEVPQELEHYVRVVESAGHDEATRNAARQRYRVYQERGLVLNTHKLKR